jgi:hypothetical protein
MVDLKTDPGEFFDLELRTRFPDEIDGNERSAALHEARGDVSPPRSFARATS